MKRPSEHELNKKIAAAKQAIQETSYTFVDGEKIVGELDELELNTEDVWGKILICLDEIRTSDYEGQRPPAKSYEKRIKNKELFAFCWDSKSMKKRMYLKFCIADSCFWYVSFHETRIETK